MATNMLVPDGSKEVVSAAEYISSHQIYDVEWTAIHK